MMKRARWTLVATTAFVLVGCSQPATLPEKREAAAPPPPKESALVRLTNEAKILREPAPSAQALAVLAGQFAEAGQKETASKLLTDASQILETLKKPGDKASAQHALASAYASSGDFEQALKLAKGIKNTYARLNALAEIALRYAKAGQKDKALRIFSQASEAPEATVGADYDYTAWNDTLENIARLEAEAGLTDKALAVAQQVEDPYFRASALVSVGTQSVEAGQYNPALKALEAIRDLERNSEKEQRITLEMSEADLLVAIARRRAKDGQQDRATAGLAEALRLGTESKDVSALGEVAAAYSDLGQKDKASLAMDRATRLAEKDPRTSARLYAYARQFDQALPSAPPAGKPEAAAALFTEIANQALEAGRKDRAAEAFSRAIDSVKQIQNPGTKASAIVALAPVAAKLETK